MPVVKFTKALHRFFPDLHDTAASSQSLAALLKEIDTHYPGVRSYLLDEQGSLRRHVNIFIDGDMLEDRVSLNDRLKPDSEVFIIQALSGG